jgi:hypothetical protein
MRLDRPRVARRQLAVGEVEEAVAQLFVGHRLALLAAVSGPTPSASSFAQRSSASASGSSPCSRRP